MTDRGAATTRRHFDQHTVSDLVAALAQHPPALPGCRLLAVDGPAGSGKTTLAADVHRHLTTQHSSVSVLHMDDFYEGWTGLNHRVEERILSQVLRPLSARAHTRWQRYDWHAGRFTDWVDLDRPEVLVLEGCGSGATPYRPYTALLVWVEASRAERVRRGVARDGSAMLDHWQQWMQAEAAYFSAHDTAARADVHLCTG